MFDPSMHSDKETDPLPPHTHTHTPTPLWWSLLSRDESPNEQSAVLKGKKREADHSQSGH